MSEAAEAPGAHAWIILFVLTCLSGLFSGLNLGLMSLTEDDLKIIIASSDDPKMVAEAKKILPLRSRGNLLLCTLLIGNTVVNVTLSVVTDPIWVYLFGSGLAGTILALALPSALIVIFGEIIPQSVCSRYALEIGAKTLPLTYVFVALTFVFSFPISLALDWLLGDEISGVYTRQGLFHLIKLNVESAAHAKESGLTTDDAKLLGGALTFKDHTVGEVMTSISKVFSLPIDTVLDQQTFMLILEKGHTRVPVYEGEPTNIVAILLVKNLLGIGYEHRLSLHEVLDQFSNGKSGGRANSAIRISKATKLNVAMDMCKLHHVHMLVVTEELPSSTSEAGPEAGPEAAATPDAVAPALASSRPSFESANYTAPAVGIATIEDFIEEILQEEIVDETDVYIDNEGSQRESRPSDLYSRPSQTRPSNADDLPLWTQGRQRLNSKHFDTTVVLRSMSRRASAMSVADEAPSFPPANPIANPIADPRANPRASACCGEPAGEAAPQTRADAAPNAAATLPAAAARTGVERAGSTMHSSRI